MRREPVSNFSTKRCKKERKGRMKERKEDRGRRVSEPSASKRNGVCVVQAKELHLGVCSHPSPDASLLL